MTMKSNYLQRKTTGI